MQVEYGSYPSPIGPLAIVECDRGPLVVEFPARAPRVQWALKFRAAAPRVDAREGPCIATHQWLDRYFAGRAARFPFPAYWNRWLELSAAQLAVFRAIRRIPFGETRSYNDLARASGLHPRQIGQLVGSNHLAILIPCHRVVGKDGSLAGYSGGVRAKRWLLDHELRGAGVVLR